MSLKDSGIEYKKLPDTLAAIIRFNLKNRDELPEMINKLRNAIPKEQIAGLPFCIINFISSVEEGYAVEVGFPVTQEIKTEEISSKVFPAIEVLSMVHHGPMKDFGQVYGKLFGGAYQHSLISDEFCREVYHNLDDPENVKIELQFVLHNWQELFSKNLERVLGEQIKEKVLGEAQKPKLEATIDQRFEWVKTVIEKIDELASEDEKYEIISRCAHVFPTEPIEGLKIVYEKTRKKTGDAIMAVDAVIDFMIKDPAWGNRPVREGKVIYATKNPSNKKAYKEAKTEAEKRRAYCFCPLIKDHLEDGNLSDTFCYCSAGWERQQWEGALGKPVKVDVVKSLLKGDDRCQFAIHLPEDL